VVQRAVEGAVGELDGRRLEGRHGLGDLVADTGGRAQAVPPALHVVVHAVDAAKLAAALAKPDLPF